MSSVSPQQLERAATTAHPGEKPHAFAGVFTLLAPHMGELDRFLHGQLVVLKP